MDNFQNIQIDFVAEICQIRVFDDPFSEKKKIVIIFFSLEIYWFSSETSSVQISKKFQMDI